MFTMSYTRSDALNEQLQVADRLRTEILLFPLSPDHELRLQWETLIAHIHYFFLLDGIIVSKEHIRTCLTPTTVKTVHIYKELIMRFKKAFDYLYHHWLVKTDTITVKTLIEIYNKIGKDKCRIDLTTLETSLQYIQINHEHPLIQAALAQILVLTLNPFSTYNEQFSQLVFLLFLYKYGYDMRRLPVYAEYFYQNIPSYRTHVEQTSHQQNISSWLEYAITTVNHELQKTLQLLRSGRPEISLNRDVFDLNDRQRSLLSLFHNPEAKITNKIVQHMFKVSQITASRDLAKLKQWGMITAMKKGRSTYYTKV